MPWLILSVAVPVVIKIVIAGADPGFFLGGGASLRNDVTDRWGKQIFKANTEKKTPSQWGCTPPAPSPQIRPEEGYPKSNKA